MCRNIFIFPDLFKASDELLGKVENNQCFSILNYGNYKNFAPSYKLHFFNSIKIQLTGVCLLKYRNAKSKDVRLPECVSKNANKMPSDIESGMSEGNKLIYTNSRHSRMKNASVSRVFAVRLVFNLFCLCNECETEGRSESERITID